MVDFVPIAREIKADYKEGSVEDITMHDGSHISLRKLDKDWDPLDRSSAMNAVLNSKLKGEILTGLLYMNPEANDLHHLLETSDTPLNKLTKNDLCPGADALAKLNASLR